jgi:hypothetical protein
MKIWAFSPKGFIFITVGRDLRTSGWKTSHPAPSAPPPSRCAALASLGVIRIQPLAGLWGDGEHFIQQAAAIALPAVMKIRPFGTLIWLSLQGINFGFSIFVNY